MFKKRIPLICVSVGLAGTLAVGSGSYSNPVSSEALGILTSFPSSSVQSESNISNSPAEIFDVTQSVGLDSILDFANSNESFSTSTSAVVVVDPDAAGSSEVVYPDPSDAEQQKQSSLDAPTGLRVLELGDDYVRLGFSKEQGVSSYQAYIRYSDSYTQKGLGSLGEVTFSGLTPAFEYVVCVFYRLGDVESNRACLEIKTTGTKVIEPEKISEPTGIQLTATENTVSASWDAVPGATDYRVCHVSGDSSWQCGGYFQLSPTSIIFRDGSISASTRYGVTIQAVFQGGVTSERAIRYIKTPGLAPQVLTKDAAPTNLRIIEATSSSVRAAWDYPTDSRVTVWAFTIRRLTSYTSIGVDGAARAFTASGLESGTGYEIILSGRDSDGKMTEEIKLGFFTPQN